MRRTLIIVAVALFPFGAQAEDRSVASAQQLCEIADDTKNFTAPCEVSEATKSVILVLDSDSGFARTMCEMTADGMELRNQNFAAGWRLFIRSPYSGTIPIAYCALK
jgi:hypothetical protein